MRSNVLTLLRRTGSPLAVTTAWTAWQGQHEEHRAADQAIHFFQRLTLQPLNFRMGRGGFRDQRRERAVADDLERDARAELLPGRQQRVDALLRRQPPHVNRIAALAAAGRAGIGKDEVRL